MKKRRNEGITLIALVITIIVLLILAGVAISMLTGDNGILNQAARAKTVTDEKSAEEQIELAVAASMTNTNHKVNAKDLKEELAKYGLKLDEDVSEAPYVITAGGVKYTIQSNGEITKENVSAGDTNTTGDESGEDGKVTIDGTEVTTANVREYLGKKVTNYTGQSSIEIDSTTYTVSPEYRLYYIDFAGKYGAKGTIYLKAECTNNNKSLPVTGTAYAKDSIPETIKIKDLNPALYDGDKTGPATDNPNMKAVTWLTDITKWAGLADENHTKDINYIVGSPSVEMMMDSYNMYYNIENQSEVPDYSDITAGNRRKLYYQYTQDDSGYKVGPNAYHDKEFDTYTSDNSVYTDSIDTMYYPGYNRYYWLASPSVSNSDRVMYVYYRYGGIVNSGDYVSDYAFCPLVSLKSTVELTLES